MKRFWVWVVGYFCDYWDVCAERDLWKQRCLGAEAAEGKATAQAIVARHALKLQAAELESELARGRELRKCVVQALAERDALKSGTTAQGLSAAEVERLALLAMAAGKLAAEAAKAIVYGWKSPSPDTGRPSYVDVERGMGRVSAAAELMAEAGDVRGADVRAHGCRALERLRGQATRQ